MDRIDKEPYLEHVNITSTDVDATLRFLKTAMPGLEIRGEGTGELCKRWVHLGTASSYIAVEDRGFREASPHITYQHPGVSHVGFVVQDSDSVIERLREGGLRRRESQLRAPLQEALLLLRSRRQ